jgi:hypothetical protein
MTFRGRKKSIRPEKMRIPTANSRGAGIDMKEKKTIPKHAK